MSWSWYFGTIAIVPLVVVLGAYWAVAGRGARLARGRGVANPFLIAAVWVLAEATVARVPFGGFSWGEVGYAFHNIELGRRAGERRRRRARDVLRGRPQRVPRRRGGQRMEPAARHRSRARLAPARRRPRRGRSSSRSSRSRCAARPIPTGPLRVAILQGNDKNRDLTQAEIDDAVPAQQPLQARGDGPRSASTSWCSRSRAWTPTRAPIAYLRSRPRGRRPAARTPGCSPTRWPTRPRRRPARGREGAQPQRAVRARRLGRGHVRETPPRAVRRIRPVPRRARRARSAR